MSSPTTNLPGIVLPEELLPWLTTPHEVEEEDVYDHVAWQTGPTRTRRTATQANRDMNVSMILNQTRLAKFHDWYENVLKAGSVPFSIQVQDFGPDLVWFKAYMPTYTSDHQSGTDSTIISSKVYLEGDPDYTGPDLGTFAASVMVPLFASATAALVPVIFAAVVTVALDAVIGSLTFAADASPIPLDAIIFADPVLPPGVILRQSRRAYVVPDGSAVILRQSALTYTPPTVII